MSEFVQMIRAASQKLMKNVSIMGDLQVCHQQETDVDMNHFKLISHYMINDKQGPKFRTNDFVPPTTSVELIPGKLIKLAYDKEKGSLSKIQQ
jgi:pyruvate kinase